jgi:AcrR family transcriptional regulator
VSSVFYEYGSFIKHRSGAFVSIQDRKAKEKEERRTAILNASEKLFLEKGIDNTTINDIACACDLAKGTIYLYFDSKNHLVLQLTIKVLDSLYEYTKKKVESATTSIEMIKKYYQSLYNFSILYPLSLMLTKYWDLISISTQKQDYSKEAKKIINSKNKFYSLILKAFELGNKDKLIKKSEDPIKYISVTETALMGTISFALGKVDILDVKLNINPEEVVDLLIDIFIRDLKPE